MVSCKEPRDDEADEGLEFLRECKRCDEGEPLRSSDEKEDSSQFE